MSVLPCFEQEAYAAPDASAIACAGRRVTYRELNATADRIADGLVQAGVTAGALIAVLLDRSPEMIATLLGIWKVGAACLPIDPISPLERLAFLIEDAAAPFLITQRSVPASVSRAARVLKIEDLCAAGLAATRSAADPLLSDSLAYVVYTSGSTGKPKGVKICHRGLANTVNAVRQDLALTATDVVLAWSNPAFDVAFLEICLPLICGATLYLGEGQPGGESRLAQLRRSAATVLLGTPTMYRLLLEEGWRGDARIQLIAGGEVLPLDLGRKLAGMCRTLWNQYGPTETSICATRERVRSDAEIITIGYPLPHVTVHLLAPDYQPVPSGSVGEIYIGGAGVALGYLNRPELTQGSFLPDPLATDAGGLLYKSGDLAMQRTDGRFIFVGRADSQVKLRGFRIELEEIQSALRACAGVRAAVVRAIEMEPGDQRLVAFVIADQGSGAQQPAQDWKQALSDRLPAYMVPSEFVQLSQFPTTSSGKVDLNALDLLRSPAPAPQVFSGDAIEVWLQSTWQRLLKRDNFGLHDDFFSLGGHSLLAARMLTRVEEHFGCKVPHAVLGEAPTICGLAGYIRQGTPAPWPAVVTLQTGARKPPLFIAHGIGGSVLSFMELAKELGPEQPVYAFQLPVFIAAHQASLSQLAANYLRQVRRLQPYGPYQLAGHSSGGLMAFEMACQLMDQGEVVSLLALLDCRPDLGRSPQRRWSDWRGLVAACRRIRVRFQLGEVNLRVWLRRRIDHERIQLSTWLAQRARRAGDKPGGSVRAEGYLALAMREYQLKPYFGAVTLFIAQDEPRPDAGPAQAWAAQTLGNCETLPVRGTHLTMLSRPNVATLAQLLAQRLQAAPSLQESYSEATA